MLPNSGITTTVVGNEIGLSTHALSKLILPAKTGGSNNGSYNQAFWTKDHYKEGTSAIGLMIKGADPFFNIFAQKSPVIWENAGGDLRPRLRNSGNSTTQNYSFSLGDFRNYDHKETRAELDMPATLASSGTTIRRDITYSFPSWLSGNLPHVEGRACWVLSYVEPDVPEYHFDFAGVIPDIAIGAGDQGQFKATLTGMPQYKDESLNLKLYVSVWTYNGNLDPQWDMDYTHYTYQYKMPDIGKAYTTTTVVTGTKDRPSQSFNMYITIDVGTAGTVSNGFYTRINNSTITYQLDNLELVDDCYLVVDDTNHIVDEIPMGYYPVYKNTINFPGTNFQHFTIKSKRT